MKLKEKDGRGVNLEGGHTAGGTRCRHKKNTLPFTTPEGLPEDQVLTGVNVLCGNRGGKTQHEQLSLQKKKK